MAQRTDGHERDTTGFHSVSLGLRPLSFGSNVLDLLQQLAPTDGDLLVAFVNHLLAPLAVHECAVGVRSTKIFVRAAFASSL